jgi:hypothetical protein
MFRSLSGLMTAMPRRVRGFVGSQFTMPLCQAVLGHVPTAPEVRDALRHTDADDHGHLALHAALAAEVYEAAQPDAAERFVRDGQLRGYVFSGGKWRAGWAFLLGSGPGDLKDALEAREFMVFESSGRPTHPVYWMQMMVRYAMVWGQIPPGEDHEMGHFLEDDLPGVIIVRGKVSALEALLALAMMKLGCPAIVPPDFPYEEGRQARVGDAGDVIDALATLPNLRVREAEGRRISLPPYCDPAWAREPFEAGRTVGGRSGFFQLRRAEVNGGVEIVREQGGALGVLIEVGDERLDAATSLYVEEVAAGVPGYLKGVRVLSREPFALGLAAGARLDPEQLAETLRAGVQWNFPRLRNVRVRLIFDAQELARLQPDVQEFAARRREAVAALSEETAPDFVACIECQTFAHSHVCIVTPERPPMCGRQPGQVRAAALFGATWHPYRRRGLRTRELREVVAKGRCIDPQRGEWAGVDEAARRLTDGQIERVFLHSLNDFPHSSCGCFHYLAFRIADLGLGIMHRGFDGAAPDGQTWDSLANRAGGKQADGVTGLSAGYFRSPRFLWGDGGLRAVVWVTSKVWEELRDLVPEDSRPATEADAADMQQLRGFLQSRR